MTTRSQPIGLGDTKKAEFVLMKEEFPLPDTRKEIVDLFASVLQGGGVQKVVVELRKPMEVYRAVPKEDAQVPSEIPEDELMLAVRSSEIQEFNFASNPTSHEHLFRAFGWMGSRRLKVRALVVHSEDELRRWLEVDEIFPLEEVFGVEVKASPELPEDTALLVGVAPGVRDRVASSLRMSMNLPPKETR